MALQLDLSPLLFMGELTAAEQELIGIASEDGNLVLDESDLSAAAFRGESWPELCVNQKPGSSIDAAAYLSSAKDYLDTRLRYWPVVRYFVGHRLEGIDQWQRLGKVIDESRELGILPGNLHDLLLTEGYNLGSPYHALLPEDRLAQLEDIVIAKRLLGPLVPW